MFPSAEALNSYNKGLAQLPHDVRERIKADLESSAKKRQDRDYSLAVIEFYSILESCRQLSEEAYNSENLRIQNAADAISDFVFGEFNKAVQADEIVQDGDLIYLMQIVMLLEDLGLNDDDINHCLQKMKGHSARIIAAAHFIEKISKATDLENKDQVIHCIDVFLETYLTLLNQTDRELELIALEFGGHELNHLSIKSLENLLIRLRANLTEAGILELYKAAAEEKYGLYCDEESRFEWFVDQAEQEFAHPLKRQCDDLAGHIEVEERAELFQIMLASLTFKGQAKFDFDHFTKAIAPEAYRQFLSLVSRAMFANVQTEYVITIVEYFSTLIQRGPMPNGIMNVLRNDLAKMNWGGKAISLDDIASEDGYWHQNFEWICYEADRDIVDTYYTDPNESIESMISFTARMRDLEQYKDINTPITHFKKELIIAGDSYSHIKQFYSAVVHGERASTRYKEWVFENPDRVQQRVYVLANLSQTLNGLQSREDEHVILDLLDTDDHIEARISALQSIPSAFLNSESGITRDYVLRMKDDVNVAHVLNNFSLGNVTEQLIENCAAVKNQLYLGFFIEAGMNKGTFRQELLTDPTVISLIEHKDYESYCELISYVMSPILFEKAIAVAENEFAKFVLIGEIVHHLTYKEGCRVFSLVLNDEANFQIIECLLDKSEDELRDIIKANLDVMTGIPRYFFLLYLKFSDHIPYLKSIPRIEDKDALGNHHQVIHLYNINRNYPSLKVFEAIKQAGLQYTKTSANFIDSMFRHHTEIFIELCHHNPDLLKHLQQDPMKASAYLLHVERLSEGNLPLPDGGLLKWQRSSDSEKLDWIKMNIDILKEFNIPSTNFIIAEICAGNIFDGISELEIAFEHYLKIPEDFEHYEDVLLQIASLELLIRDKVDERVLNALHTKMQHAGGDAQRFFARVDAEKSIHNNVLRSVNEQVKAVKSNKKQQAQGPQ